MTESASLRPWLDFEVARVTLEMQAPFRVGASGADGLHDAVFVTDAGGLPAIPGDSIAGVLRHALADGEDPATHTLCREVFGYQERDEGEASAVRVSWAQVHDASDRPAPTRGAPANDEVLAFLASGVPRDHVRIGPHGAVDGRGKFDELLVPAGARFTFELVVDRRSPLRAADLIALLGRPDVRLGGATRRGHGRFRVVRALTGRFDLTRPEDRARYERLPVALEDGDGGVLDRVEVAAPPESDRWVRGFVTLDAVDTWLMGGTIPSGAEPSPGEDGGEGWDRFPLTERRVVWRGGRGAVVASKDAGFLVPASSIKGALRHRAAFHARRAAGDWLGPDVAEVAPTAEELELFGVIASEGGGRPGRVLLDDVVVKAGVNQAAFRHVCLDRFTQGPRDGLLFDEVALAGGRLELELVLRIDGLSREARAALRDAVQDLCAGRLPLGAGRSHGRFAGEARWSDGGRWLEEVTR